MKPFLEELAEKIVSQFSNLEELTIVFPNRRAALFFRGYLSRMLTKPAWSPRLLTIEDLFDQLSQLQKADSLSLIFKLYRVYQTVLKNEEPFDRFYFWGDMLLRDFDEVDKYLVPATTLFKDLSKLRELDESFDYLTEEQKKFLLDFWTKFEDKPAGSREEFLKVWRALPKVYSEFVKALRKENLAYDGMIHRDVAQGIIGGKTARLAGGMAEEQLMFAGFNALTKSEEVLISHFVERGAKVFWDLDAYYVDDIRQEAGQFFRSYQKHPVLGKTFEAVLPTHFKNQERVVHLYGVPQRVGQAKLLGQQLEKDRINAAQSGAVEEEVKTVIVLPDESMLLSVMHALPDSLNDINVTMGYPLNSTPLCNLLELMLDLQINRRKDMFSHLQVNAILAHPYVLAEEKQYAVSLRQDIIFRNRVYIPAAELQRKESLLEIIFQPVEATRIAGYLLELVRWLGAGFEDQQGFDREYAFHFHRQLSRLHEVLRESDAHPELKGFQKLFRQVIQSQKIPFTGEPLRGLQIMGVLETRNLDFDNVWILSLNEGALPGSPRQGSYIPHAIRKAYSLPTYEHQDAMYAYLFYRILQRAKNINLFYNTETDVLGTGEMSRFVLQLIYESGWSIQRKILNNTVQLSEVSPIIVSKTASVLEHLAKYTQPGGTGLSPSVINDYIECSLRFYLRHVARLKEADRVEEDLDARVFGNFLHKIMDWFYRDLIKDKASGEIVAQDLDPRKMDARLNPLIDRAFRDHYNPGSTAAIEYRGQHVVVRAIVKQFAERILRIDREYAPFAIEFLEEKNFNWPLSIEVDGIGVPVIINGKIDRVDNKAGHVRIIDYKTGKDELTVESIASLFAREGKRNKAAFQTILYSWLFHNRNDHSLSVQPLLMNRKNLFQGELKNFEMEGEEILDIRPRLPEFELRLKALLEELFDPEIPFTQTAEERNCKFCLYKNMCRRP